MSSYLRQSDRVILRMADELWKHRKNHSLAETSLAVRLSGVRIFSPKAWVYQGSLSLHYIAKIDDNL